MYPKWIVYVNNCMMLILSIVLSFSLISYQLFCSRSKPGSSAVSGQHCCWGPVWGYLCSQYQQWLFKAPVWLCERTGNSHRMRWSSTLSFCRLLLRDYPEVTIAPSQAHSICICLLVVFVLRSSIHGLICPELFWPANSCIQWANSDCLG